MKRLAILAAAGMVLAGCSHNGRVHEHMIFSGVTPQSDNTAIRMAEATCEVEDLNAQRGALLQQAYAMRHVIADHEYGRDTSLQTRVLELVNAFETDLDGAYTSVLTTCRSHAICMHNNGYEEGYCMNTRDEWRASRDQFAGMSANLANIRLSVIESCSDCEEDLDGMPGRGHGAPGGHGQGHGGHGHGAHPAHGHGASYDRPVGSVFSAPQRRGGSGE